MTLKLFSPKEKRDLQAVLHTANPKNRFTLEALHGFLYGLAIIPEPVPPSEWLPMVLGDEIKIDSLPIDEQLLTPLFEAYNRFMDKADKEQLAFPFEMENLKVGDLEQMYDWTVGFFTAMTLRPDIWNIPEDENTLTEAQKELSNCFSIVMGIALPEELPELFPSEEGRTQEEEDKLQATLFGLLPLAVERIQEYAATGTLEMPADNDDRREKIGRNEPCPCGSGKKYKKCCGK
jgi:uncharacterized protein